MNSIRVYTRRIFPVAHGILRRRLMGFGEDAGRRLFNERITRMTVGGGIRSLSTSSVIRHKHLEPPKPGEGLTVTFVTPEGDRTTLQVREGDSLLDIAHEHDIDLEGACEGSLACSTCHVIVEPEFYDKMEEPTDEENDMLDLAPGLTETSRLGCQVIMCKDFDGMVVTLPNATRNVQSERFAERQQSPSVQQRQSQAQSQQ